MALIVAACSTDGGRRGALLGCGFALGQPRRPRAGAARALRGLPLALDAAGRRPARSSSTRRSSCGPTCRRSRCSRVGVAVFVARASCACAAPSAPLGRGRVPRMTELPAARAAAHAPARPAPRHGDLQRPAAHDGLLPRPARPRPGARGRQRRRPRRAPLLVRRRRTGPRARCCPSWSTPRWSPGRSAWARCTTSPWRWPASDELDAWRDYLRSRGVDCTDVFDRGGLRSIYLRDPDGNIVEIATASG